MPAAARHNKTAPRARDSRETPLEEICLQLIDEVTGKMQADPELEDPETVHDARVMTKRLRAAWRLVKPVVKGKKAEKGQKVLKELSGNLASARDQAVLISVATKLRDQARDAGRGDAVDGFDRVIEWLERSFEVDDSLGTKAHTRELLKMLEEEREAWASVKLDEAGLRVVRNRLKRTREEANADYRKASKDRSPEVWHEWRKAVKRLRYQREFLAGVQGRNLHTFDQQISRLGSGLGDRNDLANLRRAVQTSGLEGRAAKAVHREIGEEERRVCGHCLRLGRRIAGHDGR